jgi:hypothetical protein
LHARGAQNPPAAVGFERAIEIARRGRDHLGQADRVFERYLDSLMEPGKSPFDSLPADVVAARRKASQETSGGVSLPAPPPSAFGVPDGPDAEWVKRRLTPHPISTYESKLNIKGPVGNNLPRTYVRCTNPS